MGGGAVTYKSDEGAPTDTQSNQRDVSDNFLAKKGSLGDRPKKWVIGGEITQNSGQNLFVLYAESKYTAMKHLQSTSTSTKILSKVVKR